jgi:hypothetical protein|tara:strand:- start:373 stop:543 length:171 start_codon:yes stop_codon:yes gene_type:complete
MNLGALLALVKLAQDTGVLEKGKPFIKFFDIPIGYAGLGLPPPKTVLTEEQKRALR